MRNRMNLGGVVAVLLMTLVFLVGTAIPAAGAETVDLSGVPQLKETSKQRDERMQWWRDAKYGMFVHWGPCSLTGKDLSWSRGGDKPWDIRGVQNTHKMDPVYDNLYKRFDPVKFNADEFVKIAEDAGMKYMVLICKHHDGFSISSSSGRVTSSASIASPRRSWKPRSWLAAIWSPSRKAVPRPN